MTPTYRDWAVYWTKANAFLVAPAVAVTIALEKRHDWQVWLSGLALVYGNWYLGLVLPALFLNRRKEK